MSNKIINKTKEEPVQTNPSGAICSDQTGRGAYHLISTKGLRRLALRYEAGNIQKGDRNWEKGIPMSVAMNKIARHWSEHLEGDRTEDHLAAIAFWSFALMHFEENNRHDLDDLPGNKDRVK